MPCNKLWICNEASNSEAEKLSREAGISQLMAKVLLSRGIEDAACIKSFISPSMDDLNDPFLLKDMDKAVCRIIDALGRKDKIIIYGDYDVDGVTSTSILYDFLLRQGADVDYYIPDRLDEGYGISIDAVNRILKLQASLIITVDCGITAVNEVKYINENNIDIIITDHHKCKDELPEAYAIINPCRNDCTYPFPNLAGVGVVYKLLNALCIKLNLGEMHQDYLDLVALGTVADVVPLLDENRIIVRYGIPRIENTGNLGLRTLINSSGLKDKPITSLGISFVIAPRVNAAGRIGNAKRAVKLFTTRDESEAAGIVAELNEENRVRQETEAEILRQVIEIIEAQVDLKKEKVIVVEGSGWHHGVIGIVASKVTEKYYRPCILISNESGVCKGSGRSIEGFNLYRALSHCTELLERFGGHELAAGLALKTDNVIKFRRMINEYADLILEEKDLIPRIKVDLFINAGDMTLENARELGRLAPFGAGNPDPVFACGNLKISEIRTVGESKHLKLRLQDNRFYVDSIGFNMGNYADTLINGDVLQAAFSLEINYWNSSERLQLNLKDIRPSDGKASFL